MEVMTDSDFQTLRWRFWRLPWKKRNELLKKHWHDAIKDEPIPQTIEKQILVYLRSQNKLADLWQDIIDWETVDAYDA